MLISQADLTVTDYDGRAWHREVAHSLSVRLTPPSAFPCTFSQNAWRRGLVDFIFVEDLTAESLTACREGLRDYVEASRRWDGSVNTARPLVVAFSEACITDPSLAGYHALGWRVLQDWHDHDPSDWPKEVSADATAPFWTMCFAGMQLFVNMSCPAHVARKSRNLGPHMLFIVNPRERFDIVAGDTEAGWKQRRTIRARCEAYDGQPHAPELGSYQAGQLEWRQYGLSDVNGQMADTCPFRFRGR